MKLYIAGTFHDPRIESQQTSETLTKLGHTIVSRWHLPGNWQSESKQRSYEDREGIARVNFQDLDSAHVVVAIPFKDHHLRGLHVEVGYAIAKGKPVYVLGSHTDLNTMTCHKSLVRYYSTLGDLGNSIPKDVRVEDPRGEVYDLDPVWNKHFEGDSESPILGTINLGGCTVIVLEDGSLWFNRCQDEDPGFFKVVKRDSSNSQ